MTMIRPARPATLSLSFTRAEVGAGYLWLQYSVDPAPEQVRGSAPVRDVACGTATDVAGVPFADCRSSYRLALDFTHVVGVLAVGPLRPDTSRLYVRFAPLVATPDLDVAECDVEVDLRGDTVTRVTGRMR